MGFVYWIITQLLLLKLCFSLLNCPLIIVRGLDRILVQIGKKAPNFNWITLMAYEIDPPRDTS